MCIYIIIHYNQPTVHLCRQETFRQKHKKEMYFYLCWCSGDQMAADFLHNFYVTAAAVDILIVLQLAQDMTVSKMSETVRVKSHFRHTVNYLKKLGVPTNNSIQVRHSKRFKQIDFNRQIDLTNQE